MELHDFLYNESTNMQPVQSASFNLDNCPKFRAQTSQYQTLQGHLSGGTQACRNSMQKQKVGPKSRPLTTAQRHHQDSRDSLPCVASQRKPSIFGGNEHADELHYRLREYQNVQLDHEESFDLLSIANGFAQQVLMLQNELKGQQKAANQTQLTLINTLQNQAF